jgi:hypothetical protein
VESTFLGLIPRGLFLDEMRNILHEMNRCMRSKDKLGIARKNVASPVREVSSTHCESEKSGKIQQNHSCATIHMHFAHTTSHEEIHRRGIRALLLYTHWRHCVNSFRAKFFAFRGENGTREIRPKRKSTLIINGCYIKRRSGRFDQYWITKV